MPPRPQSGDNRRCMLKGAGWQQEDYLEVPGWLLWPLALTAGRNGPTGGDAPGLRAINIEWRNCYSIMTIFKILVNRILDWASEKTGYAAVRDWTTIPRQGEVVVYLPAYTQVDSFSCGAVAGFQVVKSIYPGAEFSDFYAEVNSDPGNGIRIRQLVRALRRFGVVVRSHNRMTPPQLCRCLEQGKLVVVTIQNPGSDHLHVGVVHGYSETHVMLSNNGVSWLPFRRRITWECFEQIWNPYGNGLVCCEPQD